MCGVRRGPAQFAAVQSALLYRLLYGAPTLGRVAWGSGARGPCPTRPDPVSEAGSRPALAVIADLDRGALKPQAGAAPATWSGTPRDFSSARSSGDVPESTITRSKAVSGASW
jgi:hypothetical protein